MNTNSRFKLAAAVTGAVAIAATWTMLGSAAAPKFYPDDPIWVEHDTQDASGMKPLDVNLFVDFAYNVITGRGEFDKVRARNLNTVDEVPDSNWFTNRAGRIALTPADIAVGPNTGHGPAPGAWTITSSKSDGVTPGFTIKDAKGQRWFLKFDAPGFRGMATGTEVTITKLMWALGYHVPENHISYLRREQLVIGSGAKFTPAGGRERGLKAGDIDSLLKRADREADGSYRIVASKALEGKPIGRIRFMETRPDDPNDVVAHEHRRELRGYGVFAAWLNHVDVKAINSLDTLITKDGRSFVRHHLIDFGSALGSGAVEPAEYWAGAQYLIDPAMIGKQMIGFGFVYPRWHTTEFYEARSIGRLPKDNTSFDPDQWKPREPNRAFLHARADDKFWAAQRLVTLNTNLLRAAVKAGDFGDPQSEQFLVQALAERRDAIARVYLTGVNPIANPAIDSEGMLTFQNAAVDADVARAPKGYRATWFAFDNATGVTRGLGDSEGRTTMLETPDLPKALGVYIKVELSATGAAHSAWEKPVDVYFRRDPNGWTLVGFERMPDAPVHPMSTN